MKKNVLYFLRFAIVSCFIYSCSSNDKGCVYSNATPFSDENVTSKKIYGKEIPTNELLYAFSFIKHKDQYICCNNMGDYKFSIYDTLGILKSNFLTIGKADSEVIQAHTVNYCEYRKEISISDVQQCKLLVYDIDSIFLQKVTPKSIIKLKEPISDFMLPYKDGVVTLSNRQFDGNLITIYNYQGEKINSFGEFIPINGEVVFPYTTNQGTILLNEREDKLAVFYRYVDLIEIYDLKNSKLIKRLHGPNKYQLDFKSIDKKQSKNVRMIAASPTDKTRVTYFRVIHRDNKLWALYSGSKYIEDNYQCSIVYVFDWSGKLLEKYELDHNACPFDIDIANNRLIGLQDMDGEEKFFEYDL